MKKILCRYVQLVVLVLAPELPRQQSDCRSLLVFQSESDHFSFTRKPLNHRSRTS